MKPGTTGDRAGLGALALAEGAPLPSAVGWDTTRDRCPAGCGGIATAWIEPLTGRTMEGCTRCDRAVVLTGRAAIECEQTITPAPRVVKRPVVKLTHCKRCGVGLDLYQRQYCSRRCYLESTARPGTVLKTQPKAPPPRRTCECGCRRVLSLKQVRFASAKCKTRGLSRDAALAKHPQEAA